MMVKLRNLLDIIKGQKYVPVLIVLAILWYLFLTVLQYFYQRPLWNDEHAVFLSISAFSLPQMFQEPLLKWQIFPRVYLLLIQKFSAVFNFSLLSLRFFPFLCMISSFFMWVKISKYEMKNSFSRFVFLLSWSASAAMIYYASELKQYSMDMLSASIFIIFMYNQDKLQRNKNDAKYLVLLSILPSLVMFSYTAVMFLVFPLYNMMVAVLRDRESWLYKNITIYVLSSLIFLCLLYFFDARLPSLDTKRMGGTSGFADYFISLKSVGDFFQSWGEGTNNLFSRWLAERPRVLRKIALFFMSFGLIHMFYSFFARIKKEKYFVKRVEVMSLVLYMELLVLGALKLYPFTVPRTSLFFCPIVLFLTVRGIANIGKINRYVAYVVYTTYVFFLFYLTSSFFRLIGTGEFGSAPTL